MSEMFFERCSDMTVYVDDVVHMFGRMKMCHCWADTLEELLEMMEAIGVQRKWIQGHQALSVGPAKQASWVHFDISLGKKKLALERGAVLTDKYGPVEYVARLRGDTKKLEQIAQCRQLQ